MSVLKATIPTDAEGIGTDDGQQLVALRRSMVRFHRRLAETQPVVRELEQTAWAFRTVSVITAIEVTMVNVELAIGVLSGPSVPITLFGGQAVRSEHQAGDTASPDSRKAWEQVWTLRYSATQFGAKVNQVLSHRPANGLIRAQSRVLVATVTAITRLVEVIGGLPVPSEFLELVR